MTAGTSVIYNSTTGEIVGMIIGGSDLVTDNTPGGHAALALTSQLANASVQYVNVASPALTARPSFGEVIPATVTAGVDLEFDVPSGTVVTIDSEGSGGARTHTSTGGLQSLDTSTDTAGDVLGVVLTLFPYITLSGMVEVV